jgi:hypothetical protein
MTYRELIEEQERRRWVWNVIRGAIVALAIVAAVFAWWARHG